MESNGQKINFSIELRLRHCSWMERNTLIQPEIILTSLSLDIFKPDSIDLKLDRFKHIYIYIWIKRWTSNLSLDILILISKGWNKMSRFYLVNCDLDMGYWGYIWLIIVWIHWDIKELRQNISRVQIYLVKANLNSLVWINMKSIDLNISRLLKISNDIGIDYLI